jgi:hypothetical protein
MRLYIIVNTDLQEPVLQFFVELACVNRVAQEADPSIPNLRERVPKCREIEQSKIQMRGQLTQKARHLPFV